ncbi:hypothetical protein GQ53DRAFT_748923 [Thozetella sp. PMI_491]|nr:hypothetical protein GQ53DRAFT_748923 [Thozetella sp. PMI_491]
MLLKKPATALCASCNGVFHDPSLLSMASWRTPHLKRPGSPPIAPRSARSRRHYALVQAPQDGAPFGGNRQTTHPWPSKPNPTPYDIFGLAKDAPYSKVRFYELVKLYHPDRVQHCVQDGLSDRTKLERYRLVVAANGILSDTTKRRLYDTQGIGWVDELDPREWLRRADRQWREQPGNPSMNATWEDWERWYQARDGKKPDPLYMSNGGFAFIIAIFIVIAAWGQATRAGNHAKSLIEMRDEMHIGTSSDLRRRQIQRSNLTREGRVDTFLKQREGWNYDEPCGPVHPSHEVINPTAK